MTSVNCILRPNFVAVATDTVATDARDWGPAFMLPKAQFLPTARALLVATGAVLLLEASMVAAIRAAACSIEDLRAVLPPVLRQAHQQAMGYARALHPEEDDDWESGARIYAFGWSDSAQRFIGDCYAVLDDWEPEALEDGVDVNPGIWCAEGQDDPLASVRGPLDLCELVRLQQAAEQERPPEDQNLIGGHVMLYTLTHHPDAEDGGEPVVMQVRRMGELPGWPGLLSVIKAKAAAPNPPWAC